MSNTKKNKKKKKKKKKQNQIKYINKQISQMSYIT